MLYIFRYFKEIQKSIFVIETMFGMVLFDWFMLWQSVWGSFVHIFALPFFFFFFFVRGPAIPKQPRRFRPCRLYVLCGLRFSRPRGRLHPVWSKRVLSDALRKTSAPGSAQSFAVWGDQMCWKRHRRGGGGGGRSDPPEPAKKHGKLGPAIKRSELLLCAAGGQQHSIEKQKTKGFFFFFFFFTLESYLD